MYKQKTNRIPSAGAKDDSSTNVDCYSVSQPCGKPFVGSITSGSAPTEKELMVQANITGVFLTYIMSPQELKERLAFNEEVLKSIRHASF